MSSPRLSLVLSERAREDIADILQYTFEQWGEAQVDAYAAVIDKALSTISEHPLIGRKAPEISERHRVMEAGQHRVFYSVTDSAVHVARVLHRKMETNGRF
jgi:toxin ParE1/3/4